MNVLGIEIDPKIELFLDGISSIDPSNPKFTWTFEDGEEKTINTHTDLDSICAGKVSYFINLTKG